MRRVLLGLAFFAGSAGIAFANPGDRELARKDLTLHRADKPIPTRVMLKSDFVHYDTGYDSATYRDLELLIWTIDDASPTSYSVIDSGGIDRTTTDFTIKKFTVRARGGSALIDVVWRQVGSPRTRELVELYPVATGGRARILKSR